MKIFECVSYKEILQEYIKTQPKNGRGMVKLIADFLNVNASLVSQIISGTRDFSEEQAYALTRFMGLRPLEIEYFMSLLHVARAGSAELKKHYQEKSQKLKESSLDLKQRIGQDRVLSDYDKSIFYSSYVYSAVRLAATIGEGQTVFDISERLELPRELVVEVLSFLVEKDLCVEENGIYKMGSQHTHVGRGSPFLPRHHHNWRIRSLNKSHLLTDKEIQFTGPVSIDEQGFNEIRESLVDIISRSIERVKKSEPTGLACLLIDWFWV